MPASGSGNGWANDGTLPGWHLYRQPAAAPVALTSYNADSGTGNAGAFVSYGSTGSSDRALGGLGSGGSYFGSPSSGSVAGWFALALTNASGAAIASLDLSMELQWGFGASFEQVGLWTTPGGSFNWTSPVTGTTAGAVDGNGAGRVSAIGGSLDLSAGAVASESGDGASLNLRLGFFDGQAVTAFSPTPKIAALPPNPARQSGRCDHHTGG